MFILDVMLVSVSGMAHTYPACDACFSFRYGDFVLVLLLLWYWFLFQLWGVCFLFVVLISVACQCMLSHPYFRYNLTHPKLSTVNITNKKMLMYLNTDGFLWLKHIEEVCVGIYVIELAVRFFLFPHKLRFFTLTYNIIDILATIPMLASLAMEYFLNNFWDENWIVNLMFFLSMMSIFRVLRLLKFTRHYTGMKVLMLTLKASIREIALLLMIMTIGTLIYSTLIYFAEFYNNDSDMTDIPIGFWWSIITMTTVGYGDKHPSSGWGYVVGTFCAISGMFCTGLPIPIIANNFTNYYRYAKAIGGNFNMRTRKKRIPATRNVMNMLKAVHRKAQKQRTTDLTLSRAGSEVVRDNEPPSPALHDLPGYVAAETDSLTPSATPNHISRDTVEQNTPSIDSSQAVHEDITAADDVITNVTT